MNGSRYRTRPNKILTVATHTGLAALVRLAKKRSNRQTESTVKSIENIWSKARHRLAEVKQTTPHDFSPIKNAEPNLRRLYLKMLWKSTRPFGNKERKRVYSWREGTVGPMNALLNYAGAQLRNFVMTKYPFPDPTHYQIREYPDGSRVILDQRTARARPNDDAVKTYWKAGYPGNSKGPRVLLSHPTLPGLDFVDMIRAHTVELCRQCFIHNVPRGTAHRYVKLLIRKLQPFLDWVYTDGDCGRKNFFPDADRELRRIVLEIRALFGKRVGRTGRMTRQLEYGFPDKPSVELIRKQVTRTLRSDSQDDVRETCKDILDHIDQGNIVDRDAERFIEKLTTVCQQEGNDWHRVLLSDLPHPTSLASIVFHGDALAQAPTDTLIAAEVPIIGELGRGRADLVVFVRKSLSNRIIWVPAMLLDIKTKTGIDWGLFGTTPRTKDHAQKVPVFHVDKRPLTDTEWVSIIQSSPSSHDQDQLDMYEQGLIQEYQALVPDEVSPVNGLWKGVVLVDTQQKYSDVHSLLRNLIRFVFSDLQSGEGSLQSRTLYVEQPPDDEMERFRLAVVLMPSDGPVNLMQRTSVLDKTKEEDPFENRDRDARVFTLYLSVASPTSSGVVAAWTSRNWHLLGHLNEYTSTKPNVPRTVWIDLVGNFPTRQLASTRFGLDHEYAKGVSRPQLDALMKQFEAIEFHNTSESVEQFLRSGPDAELKKLGASLKQIMKPSSHRETIVVIDGWTNLRESTPAHLEPRLRVLENRLVDWLPEGDVHIIWLDSGVPHPLMNGNYQRRSVRPLSYDSVRAKLLDEIIWNMPTPPRVFGWTAPRREDVRVIIQDTPTSASPWTSAIEIPHLRGWTRSFRGVSQRRATITEAEVMEAQTRLRPMYGRSVTLSSLYTDLSPLRDETVEEIIGQAMELAPSLMRQRDVQVQSPEVVQDYNESQFIRTSLSSVQTYPSLFDHVRMRSSSAIPMPNKFAHDHAKGYVSVHQITRGWFHKDTSETSQSEAKSHHTRRPPLVGYTSPLKLDTPTCRKRELRRVLNAARILREEFPGYDSWHQLMNRIVSMCSSVLSEDAEENTVLETLMQVRSLLTSREESRSTWEILVPFRQELKSVLSSNNRRTLENALHHKTDIMTLYGNNLFLLVLATAKIYLHDAESPIVIDLWNAVAEWQLIQMGFRPDIEIEQIMKPRYDFLALLSNISWRARVLGASQRPTPLPESTLLGQLVFVSSDVQSDLWIIIPQRTGEKRMIAGLFTDVKPDEMLRPKWYRTVIDHEDLGAIAKQAIEDSERVLVAITSVQGIDVLWGRYKEIDKDEWFQLGVLEYGSPPKGTSAPIRWLKISRLRGDIAVALKPPDHIESWDDIEETVTRTLEDIMNSTADVVHVSCIVGIDEKARQYVVRFSGTSLPSVENIMKVDSTDELRDIIRRPLTGRCHVIDDGVQLTWNPLSDVVYEKVQTETGLIDLSFLIPFVHRRSFLLKQIVLPESAGELLDITLGEELVISARAVSDVYKGPKSRCWKVRFSSTGLGEQLRSIEDDFMTIFDVALLCECGQIIDVETGRRHLTSIVLECAEGVEIPEDISEYPRLEAVLADIG